MIKVTVNPPPAPPPTYTLEISHDIAQVLADITYVVHGDTKRSRRALVEEVHMALRGAGVKPQADPKNGYFPPDMEPQSYGFRST